MNYIKGAKFFILTLNHHSSSFHLASSGPDGIQLQGVRSRGKKGSAQDKSLGNRESDHLVDSLGFGG
jgi:hypothetical protein